MIFPFSPIQWIERIKGFPSASYLLSQGWELANTALDAQFESTEQRLYFPHTLERGPDSKPFLQLNVPAEHYNPFSETARKLRAAEEQAANSQYRTPLISPFAAATYGYTPSSLDSILRLDASEIGYPSKALDSITQARSFLEVAFQQTATLLPASRDCIPNIKYGLSELFSDFKDFAQLLDLRVHPTEQDIWQPPSSPPLV